MKSTTSDSLPLAKRLTRPLVTGFLGFLPLFLTAAAVIYIVVFVHDLFGPKSVSGRILGSIGLGLVASELVAYTIGVVGALLVIYLLGVLIESGIARRYEKAIEVALRRVPLVNTVYDASKQLTSVFDRRNEDMHSMMPVLCSFGSGGTVALALMPSAKRIRLNGRDYQMVIIPTAPVPFGGALLCVPAEQIQPANCSIDGLINVYVSMGASAADYLDDPAAPQDEDGASA